MIPPLLHRILIPLRCSLLLQIPSAKLLLFGLGKIAHTLDFNQNESFVENNYDYGTGNGFRDDIRVEADNEIENMVEGVKNLQIEDGNSAEVGERDSIIPLPWELLHPALRILGHCLLGPLNTDEVNDVASMAVKRLYARASHDLVLQSILATRSLIQLDKGAREAARTAAANTSGSNANTPSKAEKPEILLASK